MILKFETRNPRKVCLRCTDTKIQRPNLERIQKIASICKGKNANCKMMKKPWVHLLFKVFAIHWLKKMFRILHSIFSFQNSNLLYYVGVLFECSDRNHLLKQMHSTICYTTEICAFSLPTSLYENICALHIPT